MMMNKQFLTGMALFFGVVPAVADNSLVNDSSKVYDLDEVLVISQPKEQYRLRLQPISSSMYSGKQIGSLGTRDLRELSSYIPNFKMPAYGSRYTSAIYARGTGSRVNSPAIGIYVDGIPLMSKSAFNAHTYDLSRVDVLRGPQGTLYGLNSEAGLVRMYTLNPLSYQGTDVKLSGGSGFYRNAEVAHYDKVNDHFAFSLAGFYSGQKGFFKNLTLNEYADKYDEAGGRLRLMFKPTAKWNINYLADYQYTHQNGFPYGAIGSNGLAEDPSANKMGNYRRHMFNTGVELKFHASTFDFTSVSSYQYLKDYMLMDIDYSKADFIQVEQNQLQNAMTQEFTFKSNQPVGGFWHWTAGAFGGFSWLKTNSLVNFGQDMDRFLSGYIQGSMYKAMLKGMEKPFIAQGMPMPEAEKQAAEIIKRAGGVSVKTHMGEVPGVYRTPNYNLGFYHESNFLLTERLTATLGLRYDWTYVSIDYNTNSYVSSTANVMGRASSVKVSSLLAHLTHNHFDQLLPKFGLTYQLSDNGSNVYATVSKGYRAGGYNIQMFSDILQAEIQANSNARADMQISHSEEQYEKIDKTIAYKPETSWNYEVGTHLNLFNNRVQANFAAFYMQIKNQQLSQMAGNYGFGRMMTNAGKSISCGIEAAIRGNAVNDNLTWMLTYGFTHAVFQDYSDTVIEHHQPKVVDYKDNKVPFVPEHNYSAMVDYRFNLSPLSFVKDITLGVNVSGQGKIYWDEANSTSQKFYSVLGAHAALNMGKVSLNIWGRNLTDKRYNVFAVSSAATGQTKWFGERGLPLQVGADLRIHF